MTNEEIIAKKIDCLSHEMRLVGNDSVIYKAIGTDTVKEIIAKALEAKDRDREEAVKAMRKTLDKELKEIHNNYKLLIK